MQVDTRETQLIALLTQSGVEFQVQTLCLGDISLPGYLIERKTGSDLVASIIDGRLREQRSRLLASGLRVIYIIEGPLVSRNRVPISTSVGAIVNMIIRDRLQVLRTFDTRETAAFLCNLHKKVVFSRPPAATLGLAPPPLMGKRQRDVDTTVQRMLMCVSGISEGMAGTITEQFSTLSALRAELSSPTCTIRVAKQRTLGKTLIHRIKAYLDT